MVPGVASSPARASTSCASTPGRLSSSWTGGSSRGLTPAQARLKLRALLRQLFRKVDQNGTGLAPRRDLAAALLHEPFLRQLLASAAPGTSSILERAVVAGAGLRSQRLEATLRSAERVPASAEIVCEEFVAVVSEALDELGLGNGTGDFAIDGFESSDSGIVGNVKAIHQTGCGDDASVIDSLKQKAEDHFRSGRGDLALEMWGSALGLERQAKGGSHVDCADTLIRLGDAARLTGDYLAAVDMYQRALMIRVDVFGRMHTKVASVLCIAAGAYHALGILDEAIRHYRVAIAIFTYVAGDWHPDVAAAYNNLGNVYEAQGEYLEALECHGRALLQTIDFFGEQHPDTADVWSNIAVVYANAGRAHVSLTAQRHALGIRLDAYGDEHPDTARSYIGVAVVCESLGDRKTAIELHSKAFASQRNNGGAEQPPAADAMFNVAVSYDADGQRGKARAHMDVAYRIYRARHGTGHAMTCAARQWLLQQLYSSRRRSISSTDTTVSLSSPSPLLPWQGSDEIGIEEEEYGSAGFSEAVLRDMIDADVSLDMSLQLEKKPWCAELVLSLRKHAVASARKQRGVFSLAIIKPYFHLGRAYLVLAREAVSDGRELRAELKYTLAFEYFTRASALEGEVHEAFCERTVLANLLGAHSTFELGAMCEASSRFDFQRHAMRQYQLAAEYYERAAKEMLRLPRPFSTLMRDILHGLSEARLRLRRYAESPKAAEHALRISEQEYGIVHSQTAEAAESLARSHLVRIPIFGDPHLARESAEKAVSVRRSLCESDDSVDFDIDADVGKDCTVLRITKAGSPRDSLAGALGLLGDVLLEEGRHIAKHGLIEDENISYSRALEVYMEANEFMTRYYGFGHVKTTESRLGMAKCYDSLGNYVEAEMCYKEVLDIRVRSFGEEHRQVANVLHCMGAHYFRRKDYSRSIEIYRRALSIRSALLIPGHLDIASTYEAMAEPYLRLRKVDSVMGCVEAAMRRRSNALGTRSLDLVGLYFMCASTYDKLGNYSEAILFQRRGLANLFSRGGERCAMAHWALADAARMCIARGDIEPAAELASKALDMAFQVFGAGSPVTADRRLDAARTHLAQGKADVAVQEISEAIDILAATRGDAHHSTASAKRYIAIALAESGRLAHAHGRAVHVLNLEDQHNDSDTPTTCLQDIVLRISIADCYYRYALYSISSDLYAKSAAELVALLGNSHIESGHLAVKYGNSLFQSKHYDEAYLQFERAVQIYSLIYGNAHPELAQLYISIGDCLLERGESRSSVSRYDAAMKVIAASHGMDSLQAADVHMKRAAAHRAMRNYHVALNNYSRASKIRTASFGDEHAGAADVEFEIANTLVAMRARLSHAFHTYEDVLKKRVSLYGEYDPRVQIVHRRLGDVCIVRGLKLLGQSYYTEAKRLTEMRATMVGTKTSTVDLTRRYSQMLDFLVQHHGETHHYVARVRLSIADAYVTQGENPLALEQYTRVAQILQGQENPDHEELVAVYMKIGDVHLEENSQSAAMEAFESALKFHQAQIGDNADAEGLKHAELYERIARLKRVGRDATGAESFYLQAIEIKSKLLNPAHAAVGELFADLGDAYARAGALQASISSLERSTKIISIAGGGIPIERVTDVAARTCKTLEMEGDVEFRQSNYSQALVSYEKSLDLRLQHFDKSHFSILSVKRRIGAACSRLGQDAKAIKYLVENLKYCDEKNAEGVNAGEVIATYNELGEHYLRWGDFELAKHYMTKALKISRARFGLRRPDNLTAIVNIAAACGELVQGKRNSMKDARLIYQVACLWRSCDAYESAFKNFADVLVVLGRVREDKKDFVAATNDNLAALYTMLNTSLSPEESANCLTHFRKAKDQLQRMFGPDDDLVAEEEMWLREFEGIASGELPVRTLESTVLAEAQAHSTVLSESGAIVMDDEGFEVRPRFDIKRKREFDPRLKLHIRRTVLHRCKAVLGRPLDEILLDLGDLGDGYIGAEEFEDLIRNTLGIAPEVLSDWMIDVVLERFDPEQTNRVQVSKLAHFFAADAFKQVSGLPTTQMNASKFLSYKSTLGSPRHKHTGRHHK